MLRNIPSEFIIYHDSLVEQNGSAWVLVKTSDTLVKKLVVTGDHTGFTGELYSDTDLLLCPLSPENAQALRQRLPWLTPQPVGLKTSFGYGDRLGIATAGHILAARETTAVPIFAQQSVRENTRIGRTPQQVMDDAMWGVFQAGWRETWGSDADHMKAEQDIDSFVAAGYTGFTIDPGDYVDDSAETADDHNLQAKVDALPWEELETSPEALNKQYALTFQLDGLTLTFSENTVFRAIAKYGCAIAHTVRMARALKRRIGSQPFDLEMSVDETNSMTTLHEHFLIASELRRLGVPVTSLAPRFVGSFEKGIDYIGDLDALNKNIAGHAAVMRYFDNSYKLSVHTGSDKFGVYPIAIKHTGGRVHVKTAGTSYLEALRVMASVNPTLFRHVLTFSRGRFERDRVTYHISGRLENVPEEATLTDAELPALLNQNDSRQVLHVTFGSVLDTFGESLHHMLRQYEAMYLSAIKAHFDRHLLAFRKSVNQS